MQTDAARPSASPADPSPADASPADASPADRDGAEVRSGRPRRALVTNDDGIEGLGLAVLTQVALEAGLEVLVAAPSRDRSGASAAVDAELDEDRLPTRVAPLTWPDARAEDPVDAGAELARAAAADGRLRVLSVGASPAFIVRAAVRGAFGPPPDVVLSGVNHGINTGVAVLHSGTVGAALTGELHHRSALAVSAGTTGGTSTGDAASDDVSPRTWAAVREVAGRLLRTLLDAGAPGTLNLNVPDVPEGQEVRGLRQASLAAAGEVQAVVQEEGEGWVRLPSPAPEERPVEPGSDVALLAQGWATVTVLRSTRAVEDADLGDAVTL